MSVKTYLKRGLKFILKGTPTVHVTANVVTLAANELLKGRVALITGGTSGIGFSIAKAFLNSGATVIITGRNEKRIEQACDILRLSVKDAENVYGYMLDNTCVKSFEPALQEMSSQWNVKIDILVNNAGVLGGDISDVDEEQYDVIMDTNLKGAFFLSFFFFMYMKQQHISGNILNIASSSSFRPAASAYTMSKWGLRGLTLGLAKSFAPYGIIVNGVAPGPTSTPMLLKDKNDDLTFERNPLGRFALPEEIANMSVFLVSDMGRTIVGDIVCMTGGAGLITFDDVNYNF